MVAGAKFAVIVPGPLIAAVVEAEDEDANVIDDPGSVQLLKP